MLKPDEKPEIDVKSAGSYGDELKPQEVENGLGNDAATAPLRQGSLGEKEAPDTAGTNPKRTENSRPD